MSFLQSAFNQMGRDLGRAISNKVLYSNRQQNSYRTVGATPRTTIVGFARDINFALSTRPNNILDKLSNSYISMKNEMDEFIADGYLDNDESNQLFEMFSQFNKKCVDIDNILSLELNENRNQLFRLSTIHNAMTLDFKNVLSISITGCYNEIQSIQNNRITFWSYVGYHTILMGKYINGSPKNLKHTILGNIFLFPFAQTFMFFKGVFTYTKYKRNVDSSITYENNRINQYTQLL